MENHRHIDLSTGEIHRETTTSVAVVGKEPPFIKMYIDDLCTLKNVPDSLKNTLFLLMQKLDYEGYITLSKRFRAQCCEKLGIKDQSFRNNLAKLCKHRLLIRESTNEYMVNPHYFARGDWKKVCEQRQSFTMKISYDENGRNIETIANPPSQQKLAL